MVFTDHHRGDHATSASSAARNTKNFAQNPAVGIIPPSESRNKIIAIARPGSAREALVVRERVAGRAADDDDDGERAEVHERVDEDVGQRRGEGVLLVWARFATIPSGNSM